jgi:membrane protein implicated in regulation of membrane protease activity
MTWEGFYLICFWVGFLLSGISVVTSALHLHPLGHADAHIHLGGDHANGHAGHSPFSFSTLTAFLAWFGGTGYLLQRYSNIWALLGMGIATLSGVGGAAAVFWFVAKFLLKYEKNMDPADYDMVGVLARVTSPIRAGATGEIVFSRDGARHSAPARSEDGSAIERDIEVVVTRSEGAITFVRRWDEMSGTNL